MVQWWRRPRLALNPRQIRASQRRRRPAKQQPCRLLRFLRSKVANTFGSSFPHQTQRRRVRVSLSASVPLLSPLLRESSQGSAGRIRTLPAHGFPSSLDSLRAPRCEEIPAAPLFRFWPLAAPGRADRSAAPPPCRGSRCCLRLPPQPPRRRRRWRLFYWIPSLCYFAACGWEKTKTIFLWFCEGAVLILGFSLARLVGMTGIRLEQLPTQIDLAQFPFSSYWKIFFLNFNIYEKSASTDWFFPFLHGKVDVMSPLSIGDWKEIIGDWEKIKEKVKVKWKINLLE